MLYLQDSMKFLKSKNTNSLIDSLGKRSFLGIGLWLEEPKFTASYWNTLVFLMKRSDTVKDLNGLRKISMVWDCLFLTYLT